MVKKISLLALVLLTGCTSQAQRMANCEAQGISRDTCYATEMNRKASLDAAFEKQALENAAKAADQHAQSVHKAHKTGCADLQKFHEQGLELTPAQSSELAQCKRTTNGVTAKTWKGYGVEVKRGSDGIVTVDGKPAALDETTEKAKVYSQGLNQVVIYNNGKANLIVNGVVKGWLK
ncbi:hypothetical protein LMA04_07125 [Pseudescherichia vulneris]|uniref:hypothetical protein n=1 Tax=Pseudescherichia vulneris TaxID=566 RepID=UPI00227CA90B|nr:hypothetical protein [Pseudescherichia vulneris]WAH53799.1 hypothetical protein LMA04_07125 [Pseudescherichia vulneris]